MSDVIKKGGDTALEVIPSFSFLLQEETDKQSVLAEHRAWLRSIRHEQPDPKHRFKVAAYIRYFNQTKHDNYIEQHKKGYMADIALCPLWEFVGFYIDEGGTAPNMESAPEWSRLLMDCFDGKVDLIITQKTSNISKKLSELTFCARLLASLENPVGIYFVSEDIYTRASYYQEDLHDPFFFPTADWEILPENNQSRGMLHD